MKLSLLACLRGGRTYRHLLLAPLYHQVALLLLSFLIQFSHLESGESGVDLPQGGRVRRPLSVMWVSSRSLPCFLFGVKEGLKTKCRFPIPRIFVFLTIVLHFCPVAIGHS